MKALGFYFVNILKGSYKVKFYTTFPERHFVAFLNRAKMMRF